MKKSIKKSISRFLGRLSKIFGEEETQGITLFQSQPKAIETEITPESIEKSSTEIRILSQDKPEKKIPTDKSRNKIIREPTLFVKDPRDIRDIMELMEVPFVSLSKNRTEPIIYESDDRKAKVKISRHTEHYIPSIYDWDIILFVSSKLQEVINSKSDIPPRTLIIPRNELIKSIYRHSGKTTYVEI